MHQKLGVNEEKSLQLDPLVMNVVLSCRIVTLLSCVERKQRKRKKKRKKRKKKKKKKKRPLNEEEDGERRNKKEYKMMFD
jgi:hypothetical protein